MAPVRCMSSPGGLPAAVSSICTSNPVSTATHALFGKGRPKGIGDPASCAPSHRRVPVESAPSSRVNELSLVHVPHTMEEGAQLRNTPEAAYGAARHQNSNLLTLPHPGPQE